MGIKYKLNIVLLIGSIDAISTKILTKIFFKLDKKPYLVQPLINLSFWKGEMLACLHFLMLMMICLGVLYCIFLINYDLTFIRIIMIQLEFRSITRNAFLRR